MLPAQYKSTFNSTSKLEVDFLLGGFVMAKTMYTRMQQKNDIAANWQTAGNNNFIPLDGEIIVYSDLNKIKIGDGTTNVNLLPFVNGSVGLITEQGGEIFNDYETNQALGLYSHAEGRHTIAGCKGYYIRAIEPNITDTTGHIYLETAEDYAPIPSWIIDDTTYESDFNSGYAVLNDSDSSADNYTAYGNEFSISADGYYHWTFAGNIIAIDGNKITYESNSLNTSEKWLSNVNGGADPCIFFAPIQSDIGFTSIGFGSHSEGWYAHAAAQHSHAEGYYSIVAGRYGHAEGFDTKAGYAAHAEGRETKAVGLHSHSEGFKTESSGDATHAQGGYTKASGMYSSAEGESTIAEGDNSHAEGNKSHTKGKNSHAEGYGGLAEGENSHVEGESTQAIGKDTHAEGRSTIASGYISHAEGFGTVASGNFSHAGGDHTIADKKAQTAIGQYNKSDANALFIVGYGTKEEDRKNAFTVNKDGTACVNNVNENTKSIVNVEYLNEKLSTVGGVGQSVENGGEIFNDYTRNIASALRSHAEGYKTTAGGLNSHVEGYNTTTTKDGENAHAEGAGTTASGKNSHAEGSGTTASGYISHAEGLNTTASANFTHTEGEATKSTGRSAHAEGGYAESNGDYSHAEGYATIVDAKAAHAEGYGTISGLLQKGFTIENILYGEGYYPIIDSHGSNDEEFFEGIFVELDSDSGLDIGDKVTLVLEYYYYEDYITHTVTCTCSFDGHPSILNASDTGFVTGRRSNSYEESLLSMMEVLENIDNVNIIKKYAYVEKKPKVGTNVITYAKDYTHAEGYKTSALGQSSHAEGSNTIALGDYSHAGGLGTIATADNQTAIGQYNTEDANALFIVGNGTSDTDRKNAFVVHKDGAAYANNQKLATEEYVNETVANDYVKKTDIATYSTPGLVKPASWYGIIIDTTGAIQLVNTQEAHINNRGNNSGQVVAVTTTMLDYAVKQALTDPKNTTWTEEEKASARALLDLNFGVAEGGSY